MYAYDPTPRGIFTCSDCEEEIVEGEKYAEIEGRYYHLSCLEEMSTRELLDLCGVMISTARREDLEWAI